MYTSPPKIAKTSRDVGRLFLIALKKQKVGSDQMANIQNEKVCDGGIGWIPCGGIDLILPYHLL